MQVTIADDRIAGLEVSDESAPLEMAVGLYASRRISLGQAARLAGLDRSRFVQELGERGLAINYGLEGLEADLLTLGLLPAK